MRGSYEISDRARLQPAGWSMYWQLIYRSLAQITIQASRVLALASATFLTASSNLSPHYWPAYSSASLEEFWKSKWKERLSSCPISYAFDSFGMHWV